MGLLGNRKKRTSRRDSPLQSAIDELGAVESDLESLEADADESERRALTQRRVELEAEVAELRGEPPATGAPTG